MLTLIKNAQLVNEGNIYPSDVLIEDKIIKQIAAEINIEAESFLGSRFILFISYSCF